MVPLELNERFGGIARLYGQTGLSALNKARVCVIGVGGVGSWVVEALARSGVGELTLVDLDEVCITNVNRQLPALEGSFGNFKVEELKTRVENIFPTCKVYARIEFFNKKNFGEILKDGFDYVIDAIDNVQNKVLPISEFRHEKRKHSVAQNLHVVRHYANIYNWNSDYAVLYKISKPKKSLNT